MWRFLAESSITDPTVVAVLMGLVILAQAMFKGFMKLVDYIIDKRNGKKGAGRSGGYLSKKHIERLEKFLDEFAEMQILCKKGREAFESQLIEKNEALQEKFDALNVEFRKKVEALLNKQISSLDRFGAVLDGDFEDEGDIGDD